MRRRTDGKQKAETERKLRVRTDFEKGWAEVEQRCADVWLKTLEADRRRADAALADVDRSEAAAAVAAAKIAELDAEARKNSQQ